MKQETKSSMSLEAMNDLDELKRLWPDVPETSRREIALLAWDDLYPSVDNNLD